ncbi:hypothetical protein [Fonticella tunisiensis]|uniref:Uncharacterized protein n=1 Tax=Fonticella tunisiensis TaxID=1096341 RepID=A0A4V3ETN7_9CLOT|nr:hypothetical protein [Fonticella tunisiensis]TDT63325.1 hypothetical protein EDD71_10285 [Fonticella tunisiensis]
MRISETANKNLEKLFPNHKSTLEVTDPELVEVFDNFALELQKHLILYMPQMRYWKAEE